MKLPALWVVGALATGIAFFDPAEASPRLLLALAAAFLLGGLAGALWRKDQVALASGLAAWVFIGAVGAALERRDVPANHITQLLGEKGNAATGLEVALAEPLRWRGVLRSDPVRLPWGSRFEIELEEVELAGKPTAVAGGLRISWFRTEGDASEPPPLRAGERVEALMRARRVRNYGNPGAFDSRAHLARLGVHLTGTLRSGELIRRLDGPPPRIVHRLARVRGALLDRMDVLFRSSPEQAAVLRAMLLGDRSFIDHELVDSFQRTAAYHVLVVSGLHVAALAAFFWWLARRLRQKAWASALLVIAALAGFVAVVEDRPPIERAALMAAVLLLSRLLYRRVELLNTVAVAAGLLMIVQPSILSDPSFQLSFVAAGMIAALGLPWGERTTQPYRRALLHLTDVTMDAAHSPRAAQFRLDARTAAEWLGGRLPRWMAARAAALIAWPCRGAFALWEVALISLSIQLGMLPLMAHYFHRVSLAGPLANIPAVVLSALAVPVGFLMLAADFLWSALGSLVAPVVGKLTQALIASIEWFGQWRWGSYRVPGPPAWLLTAFFAAVVLLASAARLHLTRRLWHHLALVPVGFLVLLVATCPFSPQLHPGELEVTVLDVGQGDSLFVVSPAGRTLLIDAGGVFSTTQTGFRTGFDVGEQVVSSYLWHRGVKRLDAAALTHAHNDHLGGLFSVLENFPVGELWIGREVTSPAFQALLDRARARGTRVVRLQRGRALDWGGVSVLVLWPETSEPTPAGANNDSLVLRLERGRHAFLLPGDIEGSVERELIVRGDPLGAAFLKVPHHGSRTSVSEEWVAAVAPAVATISAGEANPFGHPHRETLERLARPGLRLFSTHRDGAVTIRSDGQTLAISAHLQANPKQR